MIKSTTIKAECLLCSEGGGGTVIKHKRIWFYLLLGGAVAVSAALTAVLIIQPWKQEPPPEPAPSGGIEELVSVQFSRYSGTFVEDGQNREVTNVLAMLVANTGTKFLDYAKISYNTGKGTAVFEVQGLPPGKMAWVLESNCMVLEDGMSFQLLECQSAFREDAVTNPPELEVSEDGNLLTLTNTSDKTLHNVTVYFKNFHTDGHYLGGIAYMLTFGTLEPGQTAHKLAPHYGDNSQIVRYSFQSD